jgi:hypothetical protein
MNLNILYVHDVIAILEVGMTKILLIGVIKVKVSLESGRNQKTKNGGYAGRNLRFENSVKEGKLIINEDEFIRKYTEKEVKHEPGFS